MDRQETGITRSEQVKENKIAVVQLIKYLQYKHTKNTFVCIVSKISILYLSFGGVKYSCLNTQ